MTLNSDSLGPHPKMPQLEVAADELVAIPAAPDHEVKLSRAAAEAFLALQSAAATAKIELWAVSGFRSVARQVKIWNRKFAAAQAKGAEPSEALNEVLTYSAPPTWSRHHWGCDLDLVQAHPADIVQLEESDWVSGGSSFNAGCWLEEHAASFGFLKPYDIKRRGFAAEPWHWSYAPVSQPRLKIMSDQDWLPWFQSRPFLGADLIADDFDSLFTRYVLDINPLLA